MSIVVVLSSQSLTPQGCRSNQKLPVESVPKGVEKRDVGRESVAKLDNVLGLPRQPLPLPLGAYIEAAASGAELQGLVLNLFDILEDIVAAAQDLV
jgi:hypothetical protein